jgi:hypothetical protein
MCGVADLLNLGAFSFFFKSFLSTGLKQWNLALRFSSISKMAASLSNSPQ